MKVGILLGSLGTGSLKKDLQRAMAIGAHGVQLWVVNNELAPRELTGSGREDFADYMDSLGLERSALCGDIGGFADPATVDERVSRTREMFDLCVDLHTPILTTHIGTVPDDANARGYGELVRTIRDVAAYAAERECCLAIETGRESPEALAAFVAAVNSEGAKVNYDPANLCMNGYDQLAGVKILGPYIVHTHAKDGIAKSGAGGAHEEKPVGEGDVDFPEYLHQLRGVGYSGYLTIERETSGDPMPEIVAAATYLKKQEGVDP